MYNNYKEDNLSYTALYRKFRPTTFDDVRGQNQIVRVLKNQIKYKKIGHAYLFFGTRGTGKTSCAKIFARAINCKNNNDGNPCNECESCRRILEGRSIDVIEIDAATNSGVDKMRDIIEEVSYTPSDENYKVYVIDEVHMLSQGASNALLKTLEEPPSYAVFILATTDPHKLLQTIKSRCQKYGFKRIDAETIKNTLENILRKEGKSYEERAIELISRKGDGSLRDALSLLEQCVSFCINEELTYDKAIEILGAVDIEVYNKLYLAIKNEDISTCMDIIEEISISGSDIMEFINDFIWYFRNLLILKMDETLKNRIDLSSDKLEEMKAVAKYGDKDEILRYIHIFSKLSNDIKYLSSKRAELEIAVIKLCKPEMEEDVESLKLRIKKLENLLDGKTFVEKVEKKDIIIERKEARSEIKKVDSLPKSVKDVVNLIKMKLDEGVIKSPTKDCLQNSKMYYKEDEKTLIIELKSDFDKSILTEKRMESILKLLEEELGEAPNIRLYSATELEKNVADEEIEGLIRIDPSLIEYR